MSVHDAIQNALVGLAAGVDFPVVTHSVVPAGSESTTTMTVVNPVTVLAWQERQLFDEPVRYRRDGRKRERTEWIWRLRLDFNRPVNLEDFEEDILSNGVRVARDLLAGIPYQIDLLLEEGEYTTPVTQQGSKGTSVTYRFVALPTPI